MEAQQVAMEISEAVPSNAGGYGLGSTGTRMVLKEARSLKRFSFLALAR